MTKEVVVTFAVSHRKDVPQVGGRKLLRVNGRPEWKWCRKVTVNMVRDWNEDGSSPVVTFEGDAVYGDTDATWRGEGGAQ